VGDVDGLADEVMLLSALNGDDMQTTQENHQEVS
jgi:hypothetical protein